MTSKEISKALKPYFRRNKKATIIYVPRKLYDEVTNECRATARYMETSLITAYSWKSPYRNKKSDNPWHKSVEIRPLT